MSASRSVKAVIVIIGLALALGLAVLPGAAFLPRQAAAAGVAVALKHSFGEGRDRVVERAAVTALDPPLLWERLDRRR